MADKRSKRARVNEDEDERRGTTPSEQATPVASGRKSIDAVKESARAEQEKRLNMKLGALQEQKPKSVQLKSPEPTTAPKTARTPRVSSSGVPQAARASRASSSQASSKAAANDPDVEMEAEVESSPPASSPRYQNFILDCDGVVWHGKEAIEGSIESIRAMHERKCGVHFVTNSSGSSRKDVALKLNKLGLNFIKPEMITTSGSAAAVLIKHQFPNVKYVYVIGETGLVEELKAASLVPSGGPADNDLFARNEEEFRQLDIDPRVQLVVCGLDRGFSYGKLARASLYLQKGLPLVCTNLDAYDVLPSKGNVPGAGCVVAALRASHPSMKEPLVAGKPSGEMLLDIMKERKFDKAWTVMVGDRVDTDVQCAHNAGIASCLVLSGVSTDSHADSATHCFPNLASFAKAALNGHHF